jgi:hypothetical protein
MAGGSNGYRAVLVRRQLTPGLTSSLPGTAGLPPFISFSTSCPELQLVQPDSKVDLQFTQYHDRGWRATFYTTGMEHSATSATGTGWERTAWHATQRAAWETLRRASE